MWNNQMNFINILGDWYHLKKRTQCSEYKKNQFYLLKTRSLLGIFEAVLRKVMLI